MRKSGVFILGGLMTFIFYSSCSVFRATPNLEKVERQQTKSNIEVKKEVLEYATTTEKGVTENSSKNYTEEITVKTNPEPIELTATFRLNTDEALKDTIKLVDINDSRVSVAIYQNRLTNELTAKVTDKRGVKDIPFSELKIKRNYSEANHKTDTSKTTVDSNTLKLDSTYKGNTSVHSSQTENKWVWKDYTIILGITALLTFTLYTIFKPKK